MTMYLRNGKRLNASASGATDGAPTATSYPNGRYNGHRPPRPARGATAPLPLTRKRDKPLVLGTWNVRSIGRGLPGKRELLIDELHRWNVDIAALSEIRVKGTSEFIQIGSIPDHKFKLFLSGDQASSDHGVGFAVKSSLVSCVEAFRPISNRLALLNLRSAIKVTLVSAYAPTNCDADDSIKDAFYEALSDVIEENKNGIIVLLGDFNAGVGTDRVGWERELGNFSSGHRNENGRRLLNLASAHRLGICNSWFRHKTRVSWHSPDGKTHKLLDYILINRRFGTSMKDVKVLPASCVGSDHDLVVCRLKLSLLRRKRKEKPFFPDWHAMSADPALRQKYRDCLTAVSYTHLTLPTTSRV